MNPSLSIHISSNIAAKLAALKSIPAKVQTAMVKTMDEQNQYAVGDTQRRWMSRRGPNTLGVVTNRLRSSVRATPATAQGTTITSAIGSNVVYAGVHEFGFLGVVQVRPHPRKKMSRGGSRLTLDKDGHIVRRNRRRKVLGTGQVKGHARRMNIPARAPIRHGIEGRSTRYGQALSAAIKQVLTNP